MLENVLNIYKLMKISTLCDLILFALPTLYITMYRLFDTLSLYELLLPYSGFISLGANFLKWSILSFSRKFPDLEIHDPTIKTHVSEISHKVYMCT